MKLTFEPGDLVTATHTLYYTILWTDLAGETAEKIDEIYQSNVGLVIAVSRGPSLVDALLILGPRGSVGYAWSSFMRLI